MSFNVGGCSLCGAREAPASEEYQPWCQNNTGSGSLCDLCVEFKQLQNQISGVTQDLSRLLEKRYQLKERITLHHLNQIMQKIPPEVLSNIFQFFISSNSDSEQSNPHSSLIVGAICGRWRTIAWSTPRLWNSISINFNTGSLGDKLQVAREWLSRSGQLPLSISITAGIGYDVPPLPVPLLSSMIDVINGYAYRWRVLDIQLPPSMLPLFHADPRGISILHTLRIDPRMSLFEQSRISENFNLTNPCPSPMVVDIDCVLFQSVRIHWDRVTRLHVRDFSVDECFEILRQAPSLTNCHFEIRNADHFNFPLPESVLYHPNLTSLHVYLATEMFFQHVSFPSLIVLRVGSSCLPFPGQQILSFLQRSSPPLHELYLMSFEHDDEESIIQILNEIPLLKIFHLQPGPIDDHNPSRLFQCLSDPEFTLSEHGTKFLPHLESILYSCSFNFTWDLIPKIFGPSWRPLTNFRLHCDYELELEDLEATCIDKNTLLQIRELVRQGITIEIRDGSPGRDFLEISRLQLPEPLPLYVYEFPSLGIALSLPY